MSLALLFSGQGMQHPAMLPWLAQDDTVLAVEHVLGADWRGRLADGEWAGRNAVAQPLLTGLSLAAWNQLAPLLPTPAALAGYSIGEIAACAAAGVYDNISAIKLAQRRAALMDAGGQTHPTGLLGIGGLAAPLLARLCTDFNLAIAIRNDIDSVVVGGLRAVLPAAAEAAQRQGARVTVLNVRIASHTAWMADAARGFAQWMEPLPFEVPQAALFSNVAGRVTSVPAIKDALAGQIDHTVRWDECMESIVARRVRCVLEIGPGHALAHMWTRHYPRIPARSVDEFRSTQAIVDWVGRWSE